MSINNVSIYCPHCLKHTALIVGYTTCEVNYDDKRKVPLILYLGSDFWWIGICNACKQPVLVYNEGVIVYPNPQPSPTDQRIPDFISRDLDEAKNCFSISAFRACAVMARRAMQNTCMDKGAAKDKLNDQLIELQTKGIITADLKKWADVVRWVGNDAAHPDKNDITEDDAKDILALAEQILHIIYVAPAIADERMKIRKKKP
jgi:hypothetical protein